MSASYTGSFAALSAMPRSHRPEVVIAGRSNCGKSSLINALSGMGALSLVSKTPGKTKTINFFSMGRWDLVDLPGYGHAQASSSLLKSWREELPLYMTERKNIALVVLILDVRRAIMESDLAFLSLIREAKSPLVIVLSKIDKLSRSQVLATKHLVESRLTDHDLKQVFPVSSLKRNGIKELLAFVQNYAIQEARQ